MCRYLNASVGDVGAAVDPELPHRVPGPTDREGEEAAVSEGRVGEREAGQAWTVGGQPPHPAVCQAAAPAQVQVGHSGREAGESQVSHNQNLPQVDKLQPGVPHQDLPQHSATAWHVLLAGVLVRLVQTQLSRKYLHGHGAHTDAGGCGGGA